MSTPSSGSGRDGKKKKNPLTVSVDFRDIDEQMKEETDYVDQNLTRRPNLNSVVAYQNDGRGTQIGKWSGNNEAGHSVNGGLISSNCEASIYETNTTVGGYNAGVTSESGQSGVEANFETISHSTRLGPVKLNASALGVGCEMGDGRNTGAFVRGNVASVSGSIGPVGGTLSAGFDTGARAGADGFEAKVLGTGLMIDRNEGIEVALFGTSIKFKLW